MIGEAQDIAGYEQELIQHDVLSYFVIRKTEIQMSEASDSI